MSPYEFKARMQGEAPPPRRQSHFAIDCIALYQLLKAGLFLLVFMEIWSDHQAKLAAGNTLYDPIFMNSSLILVPLVAILYFLIAWGLWAIRLWARVAPIILFCLIAVYWWNAPSGENGIPWLYSQPDFVTGVVLIECTTYAVLFLLPESAEAFGRSRQP